MLPQVTIVIPTYNRAHFLPEAVESGLNQTYPNIEVLVVNDGSTDDTEAVLAPYMKRIRYIKRENGGCAAAKNTGLKHAQGELITNLDDDDRFHPEKIQRQVEMFESRPDLGICGTGVNFINASGQITERYMPPRFFRNTQVLQLLRRCLLVQPSVMIHRKCHQRLGGYKHMLSEDYEFWLRVALDFPIGVVEEYLTDYRQHGDQITGPKIRPALMKAVAQLIGEFVTQTPMERIIPGLRSSPFGYVLIALLLCEQQLFTLAQDFLNHAPEGPTGEFVRGLVRLRERRFKEALAHFEQVRMTDSLFAAKVDEVLQLMDGMQTVLATPRLHNQSPEVVRLRKKLSEFHAAVIRQLLSHARGR
jgi:teichuronic acid biosynthesis glycosyltransferase TuaG